MSSSAVDVNKSGGRFQFLLLAASFAILVLHRAHREFQKGNSFVVTNATAKEPLARSISFEDVVLKTHSKQKAQEASSSAPLIKEADENLESSGIPIYFSDASGSVASMDYRYLAATWDRNTTYEDILLQAASNNNNDKASPTADEALRRKLGGSNVTVIFHTSPKTASSALREACLETQYDSCNLPRKAAGNKWPEGYRTPKRLTQLFGMCPETRHFCLRGAIPPSRNYTNFYDSRMFLHMFPFRNYDEWAISALHQVSYRDGEEGCREVDELLDQCIPYWYELDFGKYTKAILADFILYYKRLIDYVKEADHDHHVLLMYNYLNLHEILAWLNKAYRVPLLPGTEEKMNSMRPKESCQDEKSMIKKYHDCYSGELAGLHEGVPRRGTGKARKKAARAKHSS